MPQFSFKLTKRKQDKGGLAMITVQLGERIRELRQSTGLSQEKFALSIGMDKTKNQEIYVMTVEDANYE